ncbi:MAG: 30S ribosomal protein S17 [Desulfobacterales bacterium CG07_land_8_20_14_0_80_52_14]|nr:MAG: 30S ribosomal protein S17 [Desulfobacterales bacterium CG23_combo_of_CG06-09_8_20_14_all_52_9]PIU50051.1 MAG: 30S ribosomal protein S17 [Desulfobacterales bacterium CG07_land_8_20_14_0_80_52_14]
MKNRGIKRQIIGTVVSDKMNKTVIVKVERLVMHPMYKKYVRRHAKFSAHDEENACRIGDKVLITESRPLSKTKKWRVSSIVKKAV